MLIVPQSPLVVARYIANEFGLTGRNETESASAEASVKGCLNFIANGRKGEDGNKSYIVRAECWRKFY